MGRPRPNGNRRGRPPGAAYATARKAGRPVGSGVTVESLAEACRKRLNRLREQVGEFREDSAATFEKWLRRHWPEYGPEPLMRARDFVALEPHWRWKIMLEEIDQLEQTQANLLALVLREKEHEQAGRTNGHP